MNVKVKYEVTAGLDTSFNGYFLSITPAREYAEKLAEWNEYVQVIECDTARIVYGYVHGRRVSHVA